MTSRIEPPDPDEGGEAACWMHLFDDPESASTSAPAPPEDTEEPSTDSI